MSILVVPGTKIEKLRKMGLDGSVIINLDLEDPVPEELKDFAMDEIIRHLKEDSGEFGYVLRINTIDGRGLGEISRLKEEKVDSRLLGIIIPKSTAECIEKASAAAGDTPVIPVIETVRGLNEFDDIVGLCRPGSVIFGLNDMSADLGIVRPKCTRDSFLLSSMISNLSIRAKYFSIRLIVGAYIYFDDPAGFRTECEFIKELGGDMYISIHPSQVKISDEVFSVSEDELEWARDVLATHDGKGCISKDKRMYGPPHLKLARHIMGKLEAEGEVSEKAVV